MDGSFLKIGSPNIPPYIMALIMVTVTPTKKGPELTERARVQAHDSGMRSSGSETDQAL